MQLGSKDQSTRWRERDIILHYRSYLGGEAARASNRFCGGSSEFSFWMELADIKFVLTELGYTHIEMEGIYPSSQNGPACFLLHRGNVRAGVGTNISPNYEASVCVRWPPAKMRRVTVRCSAGSRPGGHWGHRANTVQLASTTPRRVENDRSISSQTHTNCGVARRLCRHGSAALAQNM
jgi:hypothetical protein